MTVVENGKAPQPLYIGGRWSASATTETRHDRWSDEPLGDVAIGGTSEAIAAVDAASSALLHGLPVFRRSEILSRTASLVEDSAEDFARMITRETGKPIVAARQEVGRAVGTLRYSGEEARRLPGERVPLDATEAGEGTMALTIPEARGVVAAITPFNFPLNLVAHKLGPALAAGCPVVFKPSDKSPLVAGMLTAAFDEAGLPPGWLNLVTGPAEPIVGAWLDDERVAVVTFTGSASVGWRLKASSPQKLHVLELGSNTAMYVHADADIDRAVADAVTAGFGNSGQACVSLQRLYVHADIVEDFSARLAGVVSALPSGDPMEETTVVGPLITSEATRRVESWVEAAVRRGATVLTGGTVDRDVLRPTVLTGVSPDDDLICSEVFGPVVTIVAVSGLEEAIEAVNASDFGLNASIHTADIATALEFGRRVQAGSVLVNMPPSFRADHMPYGGVKQSGQGREGVAYAVEELVHHKLLVVKA